MIKVLFICHGNICRSPMAEFVLKDIIEKRGMQSKFEIASAATSTEEIWNGVGNPIYPPAKAELKKHGIGQTPYTNFEGKRARQITKEDYDSYDYLICMDSMNVRNTVRMTGGAEAGNGGKLHRLLELAGINRDVADPWYTGRFSETYQDVVTGCQAFLEYLHQEGIIQQKINKIIQ